jgi:hypothetical protein
LSPSKPNFDSVLDLGLRDVGVRNDPRRLASHFGKALAPIVLLATIFGVGACAIATAAGAELWMVIAFAAVWAATALTFVVIVVKRAPRVVVRIDAGGTNQTTWLVIAQVPLLAVAAAIVGEPVLIPVVVLAAFVGLLAWHGRGELPQILRELRALLEADEAVLGDGAGRARGVRGTRAAFRLIVATDGRLLVIGSPRSSPPFVLVDVPYAAVSRFGIEWKVRGRIGTLSLTLEPADGAPAVTHEITYITPANLLSIARALRAHGVQAEDPALITEAEGAWEEALRHDTAPPKPLLDRGAMATRAFDWSLWLLLAVAAPIFYLTSLGTVTSALVVAALCVVCGYLSGTRSSLAYLVPLNLLVTPTFFLADTVGVIGLMLVLTALATVCLSAGAALRRAGQRAAEPPAGSGLRRAIGGVSLIRISGVLLAAMLTLAVTTAAAGFDLSELRSGDRPAEKRLAADGRSNLTGRAASLGYTRAPDLREFVVDEDWGAGPNDGARWELRTESAGHDDVISLSHYIFEPPLDDPVAVATFVGDKDAEHSRIAGSEVSHGRRVVDGRTGYVWRHGNPRGYWHQTTWFPHPIHSVRVECVAKVQVDRFKRLCGEAMRSLEFH